MPQPLRDYQDRAVRGEVLACAWRLLSKIRAVDAYPGVPLATPCWMWCASRDGKDYGTFRVGRKVRRAHRVTAEIWDGGTDPGLERDHLCRNHWCCNPDHVEAVSRRVNLDRGDQRDSARRLCRERNKTLSKEIAANRTHCPQGHPYTPENTYKDKYRRCRTCVLARMNAAYARKRNAASA
jgi:hypothetical protein